MFSVLQTLRNLCIFASMRTKKIKAKGSYKEIVAFVVQQRKNRGYSMRDIADKYSRGLNTIVEFEKAAKGSDYTNTKILEEYCVLFNVKYCYLAEANIIS